MSIKHFSDLDDAKYSVVHDFPGGSKRLSLLVGMNSGTLSNKVNSDVETHHLSVDESVAIQHAANDRRIISAEARILGGVFIQLGDFSQVSDIELLDKYAEWIQDIGETSAALREALTNKKLTKDSLSIVHREMHEDFARAMELYHRLEAISDE